MRTLPLALLALAACADRPCPECGGVLQPLAVLGADDGDGANQDGWYRAHLWSVRPGPRQ